MTIKQYNVFLFPFAGGSTHSFRDLANSLQLNSPMHPITVHYPGRGLLFGESLCKNIECLVDTVYEEVKNNLAKPYVFFGHSMGALISYLLALKLRKNRMDLPKHLFISGSSGPSFRRKFPTHHLSSSAFWNFLKELGGCPEELLEEEELRDLFEPILRADFQCIEHYSHQEEEKLDVPITVLLGNQDHISLPEAQLWQKETSFPLTIRYFEGGHFFLFLHAHEITDLISQTSLS